MYRKWLFIFLILLIFNCINFFNCKPIKQSAKKSSKFTKSIKYSNSNKLNKPLNNKLISSLSDNLMSNIKLDEIIEPIKKLTRKRMLKLLIKSIKRVNKNAKNKLKDNKSNESNSIELTKNQIGYKNDLNKEIKNSINYFDTSLQSESGIISTKLDNDLNENSESRDTIINNTSLLSIKKRKEDNEDSFKYISQYLDPNDPIFLNSIDKEKINLFNDALQNNQFENIYSLIDNSNYLQPNLYQLKNQDNLNDRAYHTDRYDPLIRNQDQIIKINIPMNELIHYPIFINDQINSTSTQNFIRNFLKSQFNRINSRSDSRKKLTNKLLNFLAKQLDIDQTDRKAKEIALQTGITKVLGTFIGDVAGAVLEDFLHKRGDKVADHIRNRIGDIATLLINKSNLVLEMTFRNLSKLLIKRKIIY